MLDRRETTDRNFGFLVHDIARLMRTNYDRRMRALGLTRSQWWLLTHLYFHDGLSQTELSELMDIERATVGRLLDRLEAKGWVARRPDGQDRRVKRVFLTGEVGEVMHIMRSRAAEMRARCLDGLSPGEQEQFVDKLVRLKQNLLQMHNEIVGGDVAAGEAADEESEVVAVLKSGSGRKARHA